jgi:4-diphosphocytidyl-2-C-methyl-D-erythritol kinase
MAAGLGGGSSDAAATLIGLNRLWKLGLDGKALAELGAELGSDVPFFFHLPSGRCTGRGEVVQPVTVGRPLWFVIVKPPLGLATADVYRRVRVPDEPRRPDDLLAALAGGDVGEIGRLLHNRLQPAAEELRPELAEYRRRLAELRPAGHLLSGSGTSLIALCVDHRAAARMARALRETLEREARVFLVRSLRWE